MQNHGQSMMGQSNNIEKYLFFFGEVIFQDDSRVPLLYLIFFRKVVSNFAFSLFFYIS